jgi:hypothetical protein
LLFEPHNQTGRPVSDPKTVGGIAGQLPSFLVRSFEEEQTLEITLDKQVVSQRCPECDVDFQIVRGSVYDAREGFGLYLVALHGHSPQDRVAHLAVAILDPSEGSPSSLAAAIDVLALREQIGFRLAAWEASPWQSELYLGQLLSPNEVRASPHRDTFFHIAEHVAQDVPEVQSYLVE